MNSLPARPLPGRLARSLATVVLQKVKERTDDRKTRRLRGATVFEANEMFLCNDHFDFIEEALRKFI